MATGETITGSLADSLNDMVSAARIVREHEGVMVQCCEHQTLGKGIGLSWNEISFAALADAQAVSETTWLRNAQQLSDTKFSVTPTVIGILVIITDRVKARISPKSLAKTGGLAQSSIQRKKNADGLTMLDGFSNSYCGAGSTLTSGHIGAAKALITGNSTEPGPPPYNCVLHGYQLHDIEDEFLAGVGTYALPAGITADTLRDNFSGMLHGCRIFVDGNITVDASDDAKGGVFSQSAIVLVQGRSPWKETKRLPDYGGGADAVYLYDEFAYGERADSMGCEIVSDATAPTS